VRIRGIGRLRRIVRSVSDIFLPRAIILLYHRVTELSSDPQLLTVSRKHFGEHLEIIKRLGRPIPLRNLRQALREKGKSCRVIVTFDDGYADNLYHARPLLECYDTPATVFVTTGYIGSQREFWQDELEKIFLQPRILPEILRLDVNGSSHEWNLGGAAHYDGEQYESYRGWNVTRTDDPTPRQQLYRAFSEMLQPLPTGKIREILGILLSWSGIEPSSRPTHRTLSPEEVIRLADGGLVEIGSHTVSHPLLSYLPAGAQKDEIATSKAHLEEILGRRVIGFAYPYGNRSDYSSETVSAVQEAGFDYACSNFGGNIGPDTDWWQLPRFLVRDWNGDDFADRLREWLSEE
jgi:peptidoglycan/xylan/chitin deacetylase (PgdA/CDA1 family)